MPIASGSLSARLFQLPLPVRETPFAWIVDGLKKHLISPLVLDDERDSALGFCHPFTGDPHFDDPHSLVYENAFLFGMRTDKKKVPLTYLKLQTRAALESLGHGATSESSSQRNTRKTKEAVRDKVKAELIRGALPHVRLIECVWQLDTNRLWIGSVSAGVLAEFESLFFEAFSVGLVGLTPGTLSIDFERVQLGLDVNLQPLFDVSPISLLFKNS